MEVIYLVLPLAILMAGGALAAFLWAVRGGQYDDADTPRYRAVFDDDAEDDRGHGYLYGQSPAVGPRADRGRGSPNRRP